MHLEVLVEDQSGSIALKHILAKVLGENGTVNSWTIHHYKGLGVLPKYLNRPPSPRNWQLLEQLPNLLRAYGKSLPDSSVVLVVIDLDDKDCITFKQDLLEVRDACDPHPKTLFRIAIEESEAWLLGDRVAVKSAYPNAIDTVLNGYIQDSICGTWEVLADAVYSGGSGLLKKLSYPAAGIAKCEWAGNIAPYLDVNSNQSKSFQVFRDGVKKLAEAS